MGDDVALVSASRRHFCIPPNALIGRETVKGILPRSDWSVGFVAKFKSICGGAFSQTHKPLCCRLNACATTAIETRARLYGHMRTT